MYYVYVIKSLSHGSRYIGSAIDIEKRVSEHNAGKCRYTKGRKPWTVIYSEQYSTRSEAMRREMFLKSGQGRKLLAELSKE